MSAVGSAMLSGARVRAQARRVVTPQLTTAIVARLRRWVPLNER